MQRNNQHWLDENDHEFREDLESDIAANQQEEEAHRLEREQLRVEMQAAEARSQRVLPQPQKLPRKILNHKGVKSVIPSEGQKTQGRKKQEPTPLSHPFYPWIKLHKPKPHIFESTPEKEIQKLDMSWFSWDSEENVEFNLMIMGHNLNTQVIDGLLSEEDIQPDGLNGHTLP